MPIKAIKLRAVFLLLLFTLILVSSNSLIREVNADSLEESFKVTPLPFWQIETDDVTLQYENDYVSFTSGIAGWFYDWPYRKLHNISGSSGAGVDYQIKFHVEYGAGSDSGNTVYLNSKCETDFSDIRFTDGDGQTSLDFWIEEFTDSDDMTVWVEVLDNLSNNQAIYIYYGKLEVSSTSNGDNTFIFFDDFNDNSIDTNKWYQYASGGSSEEADGKFHLTGGGATEMWFSKTIVNINHSMEMLVKCDELPNNEIGFDERAPDGTYDGDLETAEWYNRADGRKFKTRIGASSTLTDRATSYTSYTRVEIFWFNAKVEFLESFVLKQTHTTHIPSDDMGVIFYIYNAGNDFWSDWIFIRNCIDAEPSHSTWHSEENINGEYGIGSFNVGIPITQFKNQKFEFMIDTNNFEGNLNLSIYRNDDSMNYNISLNQTDTILFQEDFTFNYSENTFLRFKLDLQYSINYYKLTCYDENNSRLISNILFEGIEKTGNLFRFSAPDFQGTFNLYYFTGDVDYSTIWEETIIDLDSEIDYSMLSFSSWGDTDLDDHEIIYNRFISNFQFFRTNMYLNTDFSISITPELGTIIDIQFYHPNGTEFYGVNGKLFRKQNTFRFELEIYEGDSLIHSSAIQGLGAQEIISTFQFAIWRTQDNKLGSFYTYDDTVFTSEPEGIPRFVSNRTFENFQANITITHFSEDIVVGFRNFESTLEGFELGYGRIEGVAEPHFSTTWWELIPFLGPIINAMVLVGSGIILAIEAGLSPLTILLDSIFGAIGGIAGSVWVLFESALSDLGLSIDAIASDVFGFFDGILNSIFDLVDDVYSAIINLNDNFVAWVIEGITDALVPALVAGIDSMMDALFALWEYQLNLVGTALGWGDVGTFLFDFTESVALTIPSWLAFIISANIMMVDILLFANAMYAEYGATFILYGALFVVIDILSAVMTTDLDKIGECIGKYIKVVVWVAEFMLNIISTVLNVIWGLLPF